MSQQLTEQQLASLAKLADAMTATETKKEKSTKYKYVLIVDGKVTSQMLTSKEEVNEAATALTMNAAANGRKAPEVIYATITNKVKVNIPLSDSQIEDVEEKED